MALQILMWMKALGMSVMLPLAVGVALFASWKSITISLLALMLAGVLGLKSLVSAGKA